MRIDTHQHYWHYRTEEFPWIGADMPVLRRAERIVALAPSDG